MSFTIVKDSKSENKTYKLLIIKADHNDGDYLHSINEVSDADIQEILPVIEAIKEFGKSHNYNTSEYRDDEPTASDEYGHLEGFDLFDDYVPHGEYGIHTIKSIDILTVVEKVSYL